MNKIYHGPMAAKMAMEHYDITPEEVSPVALHLIGEEGFSAEEYEDHKGVKTQGVGLTGKHRGQDFFREVFPIYENEAKAISPVYSSLPLDVQKALVSAVYRGDLQRKHETASLIREGKWAEAAKEYLNHKEYKKAKAENQKAGRIVNGVQTRMERNAAAMARMAKQAA